MTFTNSIQIYGVKSALKELNKIDPKLRREYTKRYKKIVQPVINDSKNAFSSEAPLSGMVYPYKSLGPWMGNLVARGVVAKIDTRKARSEVVGAFLIVQKTGWGSIFDMAGRTNNGSKFVQNLVGKGYGAASRAMWPAYRANQSEVDNAVIELVGDVMDDVNRNLVINNVN